jgi:hypothetical protein
MSKKVAAIVERHLVEEIGRLGFAMSEPECSFYPDGSLYWSDTGEGAYAFCDRVREVCDAAGLGPIGCHIYRSLAPFGTSLFERRFYQLLYTGSYLSCFPSYEENALLVGPGIGQGIDPKEYELNHLRVHIKFFRKADTRLAEDLAASIAVWFRTIGSQGVLGDNGISSVTSPLFFRAKKAGFEVDAAKSGEQTINTLLLAIINWGIERRRPIALIGLADVYERDFFDRDKVFDSDTSVPILL